MKRRIFCYVAMALVIAVFDRINASGTQTSAPGKQEQAARLSFAEGRISFIPPPGLTPMTAELLASMVPGAGGPKHGIMNAQGTVQIVYDLVDQPAPSTDLAALSRILRERHSQMTQIKIIASDVRRIGARDWAYLEFTALVDGGNAHNAILLSVYDGHPLLFNFSSTEGEFPRIEEAFRASMATVVTK